MIPAQCSDCGKIEVVSSLQRTGGHHVIPEDPDADWICYGSLIAVAEPRATQIMDAFALRSVFDLDQFQPNKAALVAAGAVVDRARQQKRVADDAAANAKGRP